MVSWNTKYRARLYTVGAVVVWLIVMPQRGGGREEIGYALNRQAICGPRCVQFVLRNYGQKVDLLELIGQLQDGRPEKPCSIGSLLTYLNQRGVFAVHRQVPRGALVSWPHPVILHLERERDDRVGHFVVQLPDARIESVEVWGPVGPRGSRPTLAEVVNGSSGNVVLTAPEAVAVGETEFFQTPVWYVRLVPLCAGMFAGSVLVCGIHFSRGLSTGGAADRSNSKRNAPLGRQLS